MATSSTTCSMTDCKKMANATCFHCHQDVCTQHYNEHVKLINDELYPLSDVLNTLNDRLQKINRVRLCQSSLQQIEGWRTESHQKIDQFCDEKRRELEITIQRTIDKNVAERQQLSGRVKRLLDEGDPAHEEVKKVKKDMDELTTRCADLEKTDLFQIRASQLRLPFHWVVMVPGDSPFFTGGGSLLNREHQFQLNELFGNMNQQWKLIYKATRDGFKSQDFHRCCDRQGPTMTVMRSKQGEYLFGGYTKVPWTSDDEWMSDPTSFIYTLTNPHKHIPPTKYLVKNDQSCRTLRHGQNCGVNFGCDIQQKQTMDLIMFGFPNEFKDTTGMATMTFTRSAQTLIVDMEVYQST